MRLGLIIIALLFFASSCSLTRNVPQEQYLVTKVKVEVVNTSQINRSQLKRYIQQQSISRMLGVPIYTYLYNIPNPKHNTERIKNKQNKLQKKRQKVNEKYLKRISWNKRFALYYKQKYQELKDIDSLNALKYKNKYQKYSARVDTLLIKRSKYIRDHPVENITTWWETIQNLGEAPVLYDTAKINISKKYIKSYLEQLGYYHAKVDIELKHKGPKKVEVKFIVNPGRPLLIDSIGYNIQDSSILYLILGNKSLPNLKKKPLNLKLLENYADQLVRYLQNNGYFYFTKDYVNFTVDTTGRNNKAVLYLNIKPFIAPDGTTGHHKQYFIRNVYIYSDYYPNEALSDPHYFDDNDTATVNHYHHQYYFIRKYQYVIKPKYILKEVYVLPHALYNYSVVKNTYLHLSKFAIYRLVNIDFTPIEDTNFIDCNIKLTPGSSQSFTAEIVGTNSSTTYGGAINFTYSHRNLFHGGEIFSLKFHTALESQKFFIGNFSLDSLLNFNTQEYGVETQIVFPRLLLPFSPGEFIEKNNPRTVIQFFYNFQDRPEYNRKDLTFTWSYYWKANDFTNHILTPSRVSSVSVWDMLPEFIALLQESYLLESYENYFIFGTTYSFTFSNQAKELPNTIYLRYNLSTSGNLLYEILKLNNAPSIDGSYYMPGFKTFFAQFVKSDIDFRLYHDFLNNKILVWRLFIGAGVPYKNSKFMPFGERYFIGGSNSIRAWQARTLGPGSYKLPENIRYPNQTGDIRLETNLEYRYPLIWKLEGAVFLDVGNIWAINQYDSRPGAIFYFNEFYKQLAIGTGTGIRLNLNFFVFRLDLGVKLYDPAAELGTRFIPTSRAFQTSDFSLNIAIGYPF